MESCETNTRIICICPDWSDDNEHCANPNYSYYDCGNCCWGKPTDKS